MATMFSAVNTQYLDYLAKLAAKKYRTSELSGNILLKEVALMALYCLSALENNSANMSAVLSALETLGGVTIVPPSLVISGLETESAGEQAKVVTAGVNNIVFPLSLSSAAYSLFITSLTTDGYFNSYKITNKGTGGFTIDVSEAGTIDYRATIV